MQASRWPHLSSQTNRFVRRRMGNGCCRARFQTDLLAIGLPTGVMSVSELDLSELFTAIHPRSFFNTFEFDKKIVFYVFF